MPTRAKRTRAQLVARDDQPLLGVVEHANGSERIRYFVGSDDRDAGPDAEQTAEALALSGAWSDLDWNELEAELGRIRHASPPTPPIDEV